MPVQREIGQRAKFLDSFEVKDKESGLRKSQSKDLYLAL